MTGQLLVPGRILPRGPLSRCCHFSGGLFVVAWCEDLTGTATRGGPAKAEDRALPAATGQRHANGGFLLSRVLQPLVTATIGKTTYADMRRMEDLVRRSDLEWTIMRPSGLFNAPGATAYGLHEDQAPGIFTSRACLAASMLDQATDTRFVRKAAAVTTSEGVPTLFQMIRRAALTKKRP